MLGTQDKIEYVTIPSSSLGKVREQLLQNQHHRCAICNTVIQGDTLNQHVDHQHCFKSEELGVQGAGLIRGVLCRNCNALEGKIWNSIHRFQMTTPNEPVTSRIQWLESLLRYYKHNAQHSQHHPPMLHPKEHRAPKLQKSLYNKILKWYKTQPSSYKKNGDLKPFPKFTGKWSTTLERYYQEFNSSNSSNVQKS